MKLFALTAPILLSMASVSGASAKSEVPSEQFVKKASVSNLFEIETSKLALDRARNAKVKEFAQQMINDHTKAGEELKVSVQKSDVDSEFIATELDSSRAEKLENLKETSGERFDQQYIETQVEAHDEAVSLFQDYVQNGEDKTIQQFAEKTLPTLKQHQDHVRRLD